MRLPFHSCEDLHVCTSLEPSKPACLDNPIKMHKKAAFFVLITESASSLWKVPQSRDSVLTVPLSLLWPPLTCYPLLDVPVHGYGGSEVYWSLQSNFFCLFVFPSFVQVCLPLLFFNFQNGKIWSRFQSPTLIVIAHQNQRRLHVVTRLAKSSSSFLLPNISRSDSFVFPRMFWRGSQWVLRRSILRVHAQFINCLLYSFTEEYRVWNAP